VIIGIQEKQMAEILRAAAQLIEEGVITAWQIDRQWGYAMRTTLRGTDELFPNGNDTVTFKLHVGRLYRTRAQHWLEPTPINLQELK